MRRIVLFLFLLAGAAMTVACSGSSSGLTGKVWQLSTITEKVPAFQGVVPEADRKNYTIEFKTDGTFSAKVDCNQASGSYTTTSSGGMTITPGPMTLAACPPGSLADQYLAGLTNTVSYAIANNQLTLTLKDGGTLGFS